MGTDWKQAVADFKLTTREGDRVLVEAPANCMAAPYNGQDGVVTDFLPEWVVANIGGRPIRFRPDELKIL